MQIVLFSSFEIRNSSILKSFLTIFLVSPPSEIGSQPLLAAMLAALVSGWVHI
jgi:hypothetical protein